MCSAQYRSRVWPLIFSITKPSQSMLTPYCQMVPGSSVSGSSTDARRPLKTLGVPVISWYRVNRSLMNQYPSPLVWFISWRTVGWAAGARSTGVSPSKPVRTFTLPKAGSTEATVWSRSRRPCSTSWSAAALAIALVIEAMRIMVSSRAGASPSTLSRPAAPS